MQIEEQISFENLFVISNLESSWSCGLGAWNLFKLLLGISLELGP